MHLLAQWTEAGELIKSVGVPVAILVVLGFAVWKILVWLGRTVVDPIVQSHLKLNQTMTDCLPSQCDKLEEVRKAMESVRAEQQKLTKLQQQTHDAVVDQTKILKGTIEAQGKS